MRPQPVIPDPSTRVPPGLYLDVKEFLRVNDPDGPGMVGWAEEIEPPDSPEDMAREIIWIILCAGRSGQSARTIEKKVWAAIRAGKSAIEGFGYRAKAEAIDATWRDREKDYPGLMEIIGRNDPESLVEWCGNRRYLGDDTK